MSYFTDIFSNMPQLGERLTGSDMFTQFYTIIFGVLLVLGILNCVFGYRLIRFWMMVGGFFVGVVLAFICVRSMDIQDKTVWGAAVLVTGIIFAVIAFLIYKAGVFLLAAGIGWALSIYFIHPTSSAAFFACILIGIALGTLAVKYCREVLIVATSLIGGLIAGVSLSRLGGLAEFPYGIGLSAGFALLGMLIQFAINKPHNEEEDAEPENRVESEYPEETGDSVENEGEKVYSQRRKRKSTSDR